MTKLSNINISLSAYLFKYKFNSWNPEIFFNFNASISCQLLQIFCATTKLFKNNFHLFHLDGNIKISLSSDSPNLFKCNLLNPLCFSQRFQFPQALLPKKSESNLICLLSLRATRDGRAWRSRDLVVVGLGL